ncbi:S-formylglutathione hydrolase [Acinetobacter baumannii]|uniref:S-formylglutathione hydrolase n=1 Tax=Acinetobacter sp. TR3 TaxID=3003392 RepID=UPI000DE66B5A|nr:S-formylglutathione hydrolase [Acinetobacter sp. TR3]MDO7410113.1 S-formylglutathione hydrolase [Acinetobacter baumannii]WAU78194.1 S-formylglutathione hydrolase [Acinetobacter sp. TR3]SSS35111.1 S-formylglutathione hydrolase [Acinetobacter baumannii]
MERIEHEASFSGWQDVYQHESTSLNCEMKFAVYIPEHQQGEKLPVLYWLSGLTCTEQNFITKAGAQQFAAKHKIILVAPDTSPRGENIANDEAYDLGQGAGFYLNATQAPWAEHYQMYDYIVKELPALIEQNFPVSDQKSIFGHSMGGHGALVIALKNADAYQSVSAFSPIVTPSQVPWGQKAFTAYLGENQETWKEYDATELLARFGSSLPIMIEQGLADSFYPTQLEPEKFAEIAKHKDVKLTLNLQENYDHSYYFIASFIEKHIAFHAQYLKA